MKTLHPIKYILFDLGNVIYVDDEMTLDSIFHKNKLSKHSQKEYEEMIHATETNKKPTKSLMQLLIKIYKIKGVTPQELEEILLHSALIRPMWDLFEDLSKNYKTAFLTNNQLGWPEKKAQHLGISLKPYRIFNSADLGIRKPNEEIYQFVMQKLKARPEEILFVDDRNYNLEWPKKLGWKTILFNGDMAKVHSSLKKLGIEAKIR
ncbi:MAG: hypothetical protein NVSMB66_3130 [Candidatus Doudnabacteria bacterium]